MVETSVKSSTLATTVQPPVLKNGQRLGSAGDLPPRTNLTPKKT